MAANTARAHLTGFVCLLRDRRGATAVLVALTLAALIGFTGLGVESGVWFVIKRQNQSAADVAALSGAFELLGGQSAGLSAATVYPSICALAQRDATRNNFVFNSFSCPPTTPGCSSPSAGQMCVNNPPVLGTSAGDNNAVEVILSQQQSTLLASLFLPTATINTRGVAAINVSSNPCILALGTSGTDIREQGNPSICLAPAPGGVCTPPGTCSIAANSNSPSAIALGGSSNITAYTITTPGGITTGGSSKTTLASPAQVGAPPVPDPYQSTLTHSALTTGMPTTTCGAPTTSIIGGVTWYTYPGNCNVNGSTLTQNNIILSAGTQISGGVSIKGQTVNLSPGTYWITDGDLTLGPGGGGSTLECTTCTSGAAGVTVILTTAQSSGGIVGTLTLNSNANLNLNAPSTGTFAGMVLIQDSNGLPSKTTIDSPGNAQANATEALNGLVYFPESALTFQGGPDTGAATCLVLLVNTVTLQGTPNFNDSGCANAGLTNLPAVKTVTLAE